MLTLFAVNKIGLPVWEADVELQVDHESIEPNRSIREVQVSSLPIGH